MPSSRSQSSACAEVRSLFAAGSSWISEQADAWRLIFLGGTLGFAGGEEPLRVKVPGFDKLLVKATSTYQAHAYLIHRSAVQDVRGRLAMGFATDGALVNVINHKFESRGCWRFSPGLLRQPGTKASRDSDITGGRVITR